MKTSELKLDHMNELKRLFLEVFSAEPWLDEWEDKQLTLYLKDLTENSNSLSLILTDDQDRMIGGALGYVFHWWEGKEYYIKEFFISREEQSKGVGSVFLDQIEAVLSKQGIKHLTLNTEKTVPAYSFYQKNGFSELSESVFMAKKILE
ncbi:MAG: GNAT family N-acetyltransferase [Alkalibacterium sp.]|nr:GNAT family N-acetyltransferase [Alkalibacterium sp.]